MSGELKHKMYDYEVKPPQAIWDSIAGGLEEQEQLKPLAKKMYAWEVKPPAAVWRNIVAALKAEVPVRSIASRKIYRWSAAAAVIISVGAYYFLNYSDTAKSIVHTSNTINIPGESGQIAHNNSDVDDSKSAVSPVRLVSSSRYGRRKVYDDEQEAKILPLSYVEDADPITDDQLISVTPRPILTASGELIQDASVVNPHNDKYISITAPNRTANESIFQAYKRYTLLQQQQDDPQAKDTTLQQHIHEWRTKILQSGFAPSSSNFLDILEITDLVDEKPATTAVKALQ